MARLLLPISIQLWEATASISIMQMLAEQAENNIANAVEKADLPGAVTEGEYMDEGQDEYGEIYTYQQSYYSCGSCVGLDHDEVKSEYKHLIAQLTRRSAFLTIFGLFEHRMSGCLNVMINRSDYRGEIKGGTVEKAHTILTDVIGGKDIVDLDHLTIIRNIMAHGDGVASGYKEILYKKSKKTDREKRLLRAIHRAEYESSGISVNCVDGVLMDGRFLMYAVGEIKRYVENLEAAVQAYDTAKGCNT
ncbi:hypothetical protein [Pectobacterium carotovorum]|uniref:hypothetical protein n=1 Tax=Pectobacterium carotovorum TaxID=554 RepID=UPI0021C4468A|nr:hypothetical protein [Pectobacterium carotovorum]GKW07656.1 hypothetical protein PEC301889_21390 [Pectobacterium carotovorum subsp. carotovorum]